MKIFFLPVFAILTLLAAPAASAQQWQRLGSDEHTISTSGSAEIKVVPDLVDLQFEVTVRDHDFETVRKDQAARAAKLLAALRAAGVKEEDLRSSQTRIKTVYKGSSEESTSVRFYQVSQDFGCTLHDVKTVSDVTASAVSAGVTGVGEAVLRTSELRKYRDEARRKAITAAREKATALATEIGAKIGKPSSVSENTYYAASGRNNMSMNAQVSANSDAADAAGGDSIFAPGLISVSATVNVSFVLE